MKPRILLNISLAVVVLVGAGSAVKWMLAYRRQPTQRKRPQVVAKVIAPQIKATLNRSVKIVEYGNARAYVRPSITPQVKGIVVEKSDKFLSGKYVRKGQVLFRIDPTDYELSVRRAASRVDLLNAQLVRLEQEQKNLVKSKDIETSLVKLAAEQLRRVKRLLEADAGSVNEVDLARETLLGRQRQLQGIVSQLALIGPQRKQLVAELASAAVEEIQAKVNLERCTIKSPVAGRVSNCLVEVGQLVQAGGNCGEIYGTDIMEVPVSVPATDLKWLLGVDNSDAATEKFDHIKAVVEWQQDKNVTWSGRLDRIEAGLDAMTRKATLVISVKNPKSGTGPELEVNFFCKVSVVGETIPRVYVLPREAILPDGSVYVVVEGRLGKQAVKVARYAGEEALILPGNGISDGDRVVTGAIATPVIGMKVKPIGKTPKTPSATKKSKKSKKTAAGS